MPHEKQCVCERVWCYIPISHSNPLTLAFRGGKRKTWWEKPKKKASLKWINEALNKYGSYLLSQHNASIRQRRTWGTYAPLAHRNGKRKTWWEKHKKKASLKWINEALNKYGSYLLSQHNASTIGHGGLNFSVRNGKRWTPPAKPP